MKVGRYELTHGELRGDDSEYVAGGPLHFVVCSHTEWTTVPLTEHGVLIAVAEDGHVAVVAAGPFGVRGRWLVLTPVASRLPDPQP
jgi:hypothetical protein